MNLCPLVPSNVDSLHKSEFKILDITGTVETRRPTMNHLMNIYLTKPPEVQKERFRRKTKVTITVL